jgi:hypothetical protein
VRQADYPVVCGVASVCAGFVAVTLWVLLLLLGCRCCCTRGVSTSGCHLVGHFANPRPHDDAPHDSLFSEHPAAACQVRMVLTGNISGRAIVILECNTIAQFLFDKF